MISHIVHRPCLNVLHRLDVEDVVRYILILSERASRTNHRLLLGRRAWQRAEVHLQSVLPHCPWLAPLRNLVQLLPLIHLLYHLHDCPSRQRLRSPLPRGTIRVQTSRAAALLLPPFPGSPRLPRRHSGLLLQHPLFRRCPHQWSRHPNLLRAIKLRAEASNKIL